MISQRILAAGCAFAIVAGLGAGGVTVALGAHPFWGVKVALIGGAIGAFSALAWGARLRLGLILSLVVLGVAAVSAHFGKAEFAASYAENDLAGRAWFLGWIAICAGAAALLATIGMAMSEGLRKLE